MAQVWIPSMMRDLSAGRSVVEVPGDTLRAVLSRLEEACPGIGARLFDEDGALQPHLAIMIDGAEVSSLHARVGAESEVV
ncbi:MAG TPA: hypothetical protein VF234_02890, partial [Limnochordia bacterium]